MTIMEVVQTFNNELQSLVEIKPPLSKAKMGLITRAAMKGVKFYKHIVQGVEKFISKCNPEYKVPGLYVIDSIVRQSSHQFGPKRDVYAARFSRNLESTFNNLFAGCSVDDKPKIVRVLNLWQKNGVFDSQVIQPLLDMADHRSSEGGVAGGLKFNKNMLDFDYDEDDDDEGDETPTEAEPPLSSTLNKLEMEQRGRNEHSTSSYQSSQLYQNQQTGISDEFNLRNEDPVLERWNRLIKHQSVVSIQDKMICLLSLHALYYYGRLICL